MNWTGWPIDRILFIFTGISFLMIFVQVTLFHYRQNFRHWSMWIPVLATPLFAICSLLLAFYNTEWLRALLSFLLIVGIVAGIFGSYMHFKGIGDRVAGYKLRNFLIGPPLTLPGMITAYCILGLIALYWPIAGGE